MVAITITTKEQTIIVDALRQYAEDMRPIVENTRAAKMGKYTGLLEQRLEAIEKLANRIEQASD